MRAPKKQGRVPWGNAVMGESRVEFFRHKDAVEFLAARPDLLGLAGAKPLPAAGSPQARAAAGAVLELLVRRRAAVRAERIFWKPRPGEELKFFFSLFVPCLFRDFGFARWMVAETMVSRSDSGTSSSCLTRSPSFAHLPLSNSAPFL